MQQGVVRLCGSGQNNLLEESELRNKGRAQTTSRTKRSVQQPVFRSSTAVPCQEKKRKSEEKPHPDRFFIRYMVLAWSNPIFGSPGRTNMKYWQEPLKTSPIQQPTSPPALPLRPHPLQLHPSLNNLHRAAATSYMYAFIHICA